MNNFEKNELIENLTQIENQNDLLDFSNKYNATKLRIEKPCLIGDIDCFVDGEESTISISVSDDFEVIFDIWIGGEEFFIN